MILLAVLLLCLLEKVLTQEPKLIYVQEVFRHGHRYPIYPFSFDGSEFVNGIRSLGELTKQGKSMHYILGQNLYKQYWNSLFANTPFSNTYNQSKFYVKSTNVNRTI
jgi:hypothetical protein